MRLQIHHTTFTSVEEYLPWTRTYLRSAAQTVSYLNALRDMVAYFQQTEVLIVQLRTPLKNQCRRWRAHMMCCLLANFSKQQMPLEAFKMG